MTMIIAAQKQPTKAALKKYAAYIKRKLLIEWSKRVRQRDGNKCVICGAVEHINAHHILARDGYHHLQFTLDNGVSLCPSHHKFGRLSAHKNAVWFCDWLRVNRPAQWQAASSRAENSDINLELAELIELTKEWNLKIKNIF